MDHGCLHGMALLWRLFAERIVLLCTYIRFVGRGVYGDNMDMVRYCKSNNEFIFELDFDILEYL